MSKQKCKIIAEKDRYYIEITTGDVFLVAGVWNDPKENKDKIIAYRNGSPFFEQIDLIEWHKQRQNKTLLEIDPKANEIIND